GSEGTRKGYPPGGPARGKTRRRTGESDLAAPTGPAARRCSKQQQESNWSRSGPPFPAPWWGPTLAAARRTAPQPQRRSWGQQPAPATLRESEDENPPWFPT